MRPKNRPPTWYALCRTFSSLPEPLRGGVSRQMHAHYRRIAHLPRDVGEDLDRRAAPLGIVRWVAWGDGEAEARARHAAAVAHHARTGRWPDPRERGKSPPDTPRAA